jgi:hypothetical protein
VEEHLGHLPRGSSPRIGHRLQIAFLVEARISERPVSEKTIGAEPYTAEDGAIAELQVTAAVNEQLVDRRDLDSLLGLRDPPVHRAPLIWVVMPPAVALPSRRRAGPRSHESPPADTKTLAHAPRFGGDTTAGASSIAGLSGQWSALP